MSVFPGFNTNIRHQNRLFHIQTEVLVSESENNISTLVYIEGRIFHSITNIMKPSESVHRETATMAIIKQHKEAIKKLISNQIAELDNSTETKLGKINFIELYKEQELFLCSKIKPQHIKSLTKKLLIDLE